MGPKREKGERGPQAISVSGVAAQVRRNVEQFRGGLVLKAHRLLYHSTLASRIIRNKRPRSGSGFGAKPCRVSSTPNPEAVTKACRVRRSRAGSGCGVQCVASGVVRSEKRARGGLRPSLSPATPLRFGLWGSACSVSRVQGYFTYKKTQPPRILPRAHA